jgi:hypothetical protein
MKKIYFIIILFIFPLFSQKADWATTRFDKFWKKSFNQMTFREPILFSPYDIKIGYYKYGGKKYFSQFDDLLSSVDVKNRTLIGLELDLFKTNFFYKQRNDIDIQIGLGYKLLKSFEHVKFSNGDKLKPELYEFNINSTFIKQYSPNYFYYFYYSAGYNKATFYKSNKSNKYSTGFGIGHSFALGMDFIIPNNKMYDLHCGVELKFLKCNLDKIYEPDVNRIGSFNMDAVGLTVSFGIGNGGKKSLGDQAYIDLLNKNYLSASEKVQFYKNIDGIIYNENKLNEILEFCEIQIPFRLYDKAIDAYSAGELKESVNLLLKIDYKNDLFLKSKIDTRLHIIASQLLSNFWLIKDDYPIEYQIIYIDEIKRITPKVHSKANRKLSEIYFQKGDILLRNENYEEAYEYYLKADVLSGNNFERIKIKSDNLIVAVLNNVYNLLQNKDNLLAYEKLHFVKDISSVSSDNINFLMDFVENQISNISNDKIRQRMISIIQDKQEFVASNAKQDIHLGDFMEDVMNILGDPVEKVERVNFQNSYTMLIYDIKDKEYKFFFKNQILIDVERN